MCVCVGGGGGVGGEGIQQLPSPIVHLHIFEKLNDINFFFF